MPLYFFSFFYAVMAMAFMVPLAIKLGFRFGIVDHAPCKNTGDSEKPERVKIHCKTTPRSGGIAIFTSFWLAIFLSIGFNQQIIGIFLGSLIVFGVMLVDDRSNLRPAVKLLAQIIAATVPVFFGVRVYFLSNVFSNTYIAIGWLGIPFTIFWAVGFMNALNLIDGMDGLASGIAGIASLGIVFLSISRMMPVAAIFGMALVGVCLVFLKYNFHPARIFLGDSGAHLLGYLIAMISIWSGLKTTTSVILIASFIALGVPIFDIFFSIFIRMKKRKKVYEADLENIHYQLHRKGWGQRRIAFFFYSITLLLCLVPYLMLMQ
jgi:UDP-GlcNAc:undecaprenyl-phosphate/decaprenyl-phosphate GlcNAc-1-phosphate transferase